MDAQDVNALLNGDRRKPERAGQAFGCIVASSQVADNRLSRHAPKDWPPAIVAEVARAPQQGEVVLVRLSEADAWVKADHFCWVTSPHQVARGRMEGGVNFGHDVLVGGFALHGRRCALHVHDANATSRSQHDVHHRRVTKSGHVVYHVCSSGNRRRSHVGTSGINGQQDFWERPTEPCDDVNHPALFLLNRDGRCTWASGFTTDVKPRCPVVHHHQSALNSIVARYARCRVEGIRGDVQDPHQTRKAVDLPPQGVRHTRSAGRGDRRDGGHRSAPAESLHKEVGGTPAMVEGPDGIVADAGPTPDHQELAERLSVRFQTQGFASLNSMIFAKAKNGAMVMTGLAFFVWMSVFFRQELSTDVDTILLGFHFHHVALLVAALAFFAAVFSELGNELGRAIPGLLAGPMQVVAFIYAIEPVITGFSSDALAVEAGLWRTGRLITIAVGSTLGARMIMEAFFLVWLRDFCDFNGIDPRPSQVPAMPTLPGEALLEVEDVLS